MEDYLRRSMERHGESVYRLALCRLRSVPDAEDVCQDVFLRLLRKGDPAWDEERTKAFLLRCAVNRCADLGRQRKRRRESSWEELPDRPAEERDEARALWEAVGQLPRPSGPSSTSTMGRATPPARSRPSCAFRRPPSAPGSTGAGRS